MKCVSVCLHCSLKRIVVLQCQLLIQGWQFTLNFLDQPFVRTLSCAFHQIFPFFHVNASAVHFVIHKPFCFYRLIFPLPRRSGSLILRAMRKAKGRNKARWKQREMMRLDDSPPALTLHGKINGLRAMRILYGNKDLVKNRILAFMD